MEPHEHEPIDSATIQANLARDYARVADFLRGSELARHVYSLGFRQGHDAGWTQGYTEGRAVSSAYEHSEGCSGDHAPHDPCLAPVPVPDTPAELIDGGQ